MGVVWSCVWLYTHDAPWYFIEEAQECTQEWPSKCLLTLWTALLSDVDKDILLGFTRFTPRRKSGSLWGCHAVYRNILDLKGNWGPWCLRWPRDLGTWFGYSNQFLLCSVSTPFFPLNYKPFHPAEWRMITGYFFFSLLPFISIWGTMTCSCPPACCEMWQRGPFSEKLAAISAIMLIFTCVPCRTEFSLCTETSPGNCCKTKTHQSTKALNERLNCR